MSYGLTLDSIKSLSPAVLNTDKHCRSERYKLIPTTSIMEKMQEAGFFPTQALQAKKNDLGRHIVRFSHESLLDYDEDRPEIVLINSHDGRSSYRLMSGIFRFICSNGLIVQDKNFGEYKVRHQGHELDEIIAASLKVVDQTKDVQDVIRGMKSIQLTEKQRLDFARAAAEMRFDYADYDEDKLIKIYDNSQVLLTPWRNEDSGNDLWTTYNVIQENCIKGGQVMGNRHMRPLQNVRKNVLVNTGLWNYASNLVSA